MGQQEPNKVMELISVSLTTNYCILQTDLNLQH